MTRKAFLLALATLWPMLFVTQASAAEAVEMTISVIHATNGDGGVDPVLKPIKDDLTKAFSQYKSFKRVGRSEYALNPTGVARVLLPSQKGAANFAYNGPDPKDPKLHHVTFSVPQKKVKVDLRLPMRKVFYQAGLKHDGGILILAIYLKPGA
ncbi:MAG: hypothetical protein ACE366_31580 [Bradymonadia bacterium]